jgi:uncharacterized protein
MTDATMPITDTVFDAFKLARTGARLEGEVAVSALPRLARSLSATDGTLRYAVRGCVDDRGHPGALLQLEGTLRLRCERCNGPLDFALRRETLFRFVPSEDELNALPVTEDDVEEVVGSTAMNLHDWIEDEAILSLPLVPRHAQCAMPRTTVKATEGAGDRPNPFAILASLKKGSDDGPDRGK